MDRRIAKGLLERYLFQITKGCGNLQCNNSFCASNSERSSKLSGYHAVTRAVNLFQQDEELCCSSQCSQRSRKEWIEGDPSAAGCSSHSNPPLCDFTDWSSSNKPDEAKKLFDFVFECLYPDLDAVNHGELQRALNIIKENRDKVDFCSGSLIALTASIHIVISTKCGIPPDAGCSNNFIKPVKRKPSQSVNSEESIKRQCLSSHVQFLDETKLQELIASYEGDNSNKALCSTLEAVFSSYQSLALSFQKEGDSYDAKFVETPGNPDLHQGGFKNAVEELAISDSHTSVDLFVLRRSMKALYETKRDKFDCISSALKTLGKSLCIVIRLRLTRKEDIEQIITTFVIVFEVLQIGSVEFAEPLLADLCMALCYLPMWAKARLARIWSVHAKDGLRSTLRLLHNLINKSISCVENVYENKIVRVATKVMEIVFYANILAGDVESGNYRECDLGNVSPLATELDVDTMCCRNPYIPFGEFYNEMISDVLNIEADYARYRPHVTEWSFQQRMFCFVLHPFIITPKKKSIALKHVYRYQGCGIFTQLESDKLELTVRRNRIMHDTLVQLLKTAALNPAGLRKQLVVQFVGEHATDYGGVSKEFFQLFIEEIVEPESGLFINVENTTNLWFNHVAIDREMKFKLTGIVVGLAMCNNIHLPVNFPVLVYRKLLGMRGSFTDLKELDPVLYNSLKWMLEYQENDMEDVFVQTFRVCYVFGNDTLEHDLLAEGDQVWVTQENKQVFVDLYVDFLLNKAIEKQFKAFQHGFLLTNNNRLLQLLFRPEEMQLIVRGCQILDFVELEKATLYVGFSPESQTILDFWEVVHALPMDSKRMFLRFINGSDAVPVGGLAEMRLIIIRVTLDETHLPVSSTCFNHMRLPEYNSKEQLKERLLKALEHCQGFGLG